MKQNIRVLLVDDDTAFRKVVRAELARAELEATDTPDGATALRALVESDFDVMLLDVQMPGMSGLDTLREVRKFGDPPEVIMLTGDTSLSTGLEAMRLGAYDYLTKPSSLAEMEALILKAAEKRKLLRQNASLKLLARGQEPGDISIPSLVFKSGAMQKLMKLAEAAAPLDSTVIITGESGTGKDLIARYLHAHSPRFDSPLITLNCGAVPESLFESEFFGHERGAFTGANTLKRGLVEAADGSSLFLDEIGDLPLEMQVKLLHFLEHGAFRRVGTTRDQHADVRVIAATNRNLNNEVARGSFRADLFYRLNVVAIHIPSLRERPEDIPALIDFYLDIYRERFKRPDLNLSAETRACLEEYSWPGNVRELRNSLERAAALSSTALIELNDLIPPPANEGSMAVEGTKYPSTQTPPKTLGQIERDHIFMALQHAGGNRERAAAVLGISSRTLYRKLREYEADTPLHLEN